MKTQIIAHRGASYLANHDNTIEAYQIALDIKADCIEIDVRQTLDKTLVLFHDEQLDGIPVKTLTYAQLNDRARTQGYQIPTLEETLRFCQGKIHLLIELKEAGYEKQALSLVQSCFSYEEYSIQSFLDVVVRRIKKIDPDVTAGLLVGVEHGDFRTRFNEFLPVRRLQECHGDFISPYYRLATPDFMFRMRRAGIPVYVWTVDEPKSIAGFLDSEADGIITNRPDVGVYLRSKMEREAHITAQKRTRTYRLLQKAVSFLPLKRRKASRQQEPDHCEE